MRLRPAFIHGTLVIFISTFTRERQMPLEGLGGLTYLWDHAPPTDRVGLMAFLLCLDPSAQVSFPGDVLVV